MFEDMTYENILKSALSNVRDGVDKRQGSIIYDALAPACAELAKAYVKMELVLENSFADTACREYLILRAKERGIEPYSATCAVARGIFDAEVPVGSRFSIGGLCFEVKEKLCDYEYSMECETAGEEGNKYFGSLVPVDYVKNLSSASLTEILIPGSDEEDTESFRERYLREVCSDTFGGNRADYVRWVKAVEGVGQVRVKRADSSSGKVEVIVLDSDNNSPSELLLNAIKERLDPSDKSGLGAGAAPVGHCVSVIGAKKYPLSIAAKVTYSDDADFDNVASQAKGAIKDYFNRLNSKWENYDDGIEIYSAHIMVILLQIDGVKNVESLKIQNSSYFKLSSEYIADVGSISVGA